MKKILHIISQYPGKTGSGIYLNELVREGYKKGHEQAIVGAIDEDPYTNEFIKEEDMYLLKFNSEELPFSIIGMSDEMPYRSSRYSEVGIGELENYKTCFREKIKIAIEEFKPDLIFTHHLWLVTSMIKEIARNIKVIGFCHGTDIRQLKQLDESFIYKDEIVKGCRKLDMILALNKEQKSEINKLYNIDREKIVIMGGGYNSNIFYPNFDKREKIRIVYVGKISFSKGLLAAIEAIKKVDTRYEFEFLLAGSGHGKQYGYIVDMAKTTNEDIRLIGEISQKKVGELFRSADIFIMPSYYEGLSLVTLEALASGLLIVCSEIEGLISYLGEEINNSGIIEYVSLPKMETVDIPNEDSVIEYEDRLGLAVEKQLENIDNRFKIYKSIEKDIKQLSWEKLFEKIESSI